MEPLALAWIHARPLTSSKEERTLLYHEDVGGQHNVLSPVMYHGVRERESKKMRKKKSERKKTKRKKERGDRIQTSICTCGPSIAAILRPKR